MESLKSSGMVMYFVQPRCFFAIKIFVMTRTVGSFRVFQRTAELLTGSAFVRKFAVFPHGKPCITDRIALREKSGIFGVAAVKRYDALTPHKELLPDCKCF
jgi:hypothetical protein